MHRSCLHVVQAVPWDDHASAHTCRSSAHGRTYMESPALLVQQREQTDGTREEKVQHGLVVPVLDLQPVHPLLGILQLHGGKDGGEGRPGEGVTVWVSVRQTGV